ncbi:MAG: GyrI-like domain-containing protein [Candidatus Micrarchaeota archaeon]
MEEITVVEIKPQIVMGMRRRGPYQQIPQMLKGIFLHLMEKKARIAGPPMFLCHEMSEQEAIEADKNKDADVEVCVPVEVELGGTDEIRCYRLPGGKMAKIAHKGPYEECKPTYDKLFAWLKENGKRIAGPIREVYLNDPHEVPKEEILTEIYAPIG